MIEFRHSARKFAISIHLRGRTSTPSHLLSCLRVVVISLGRCRSSRSRRRRTKSAQDILLGKSTSASGKRNLNLNLLSAGEDRNARLVSNFNADFEDNEEKEEKETLDHRPTRSDSASSIGASSSCFFNGVDYFQRQ